MDEKILYRDSQSRFVSCHITDAASVWFPLKGRGSQAA